MGDTEGDKTERIFALFYPPQYHFMQLLTMNIDSCGLFDFSNN